MLTVVTFAAVAGLLLLGAIRVLDPGVDDRPVVLGGLLIVVAAAVVMNAISLDAMSRPSRDSRH